MNITREEVQQVLYALSKSLMYSGGETGCDHSLGICFCPEQKAISLLQSKLAEKDDVEPVAYQYQGRDGIWKNFINGKHIEDTKAEGSWPIRALFTHPAPKPMTESKYSDIISDGGMDPRK